MTSSLPRAAQSVAMQEMRFPMAAVLAIDWGGYGCATLRYGP